MKKIAIIVTGFLYTLGLYAQTSVVTKEETDKKLFPTKYSIILYSNQVADTSGSNKLLAAHWQNKGGGSFSWQKNITEEGEYEAALSYSTNQEGTAAKIYTATGDTISAQLKVSSGYYQNIKNWYEMNFERRQIPGTLYLRKGQNSIHLQLHSNEQATTNLYSLELIPVKKKTAIEKDQSLAQKKNSNTKWFAQIPYGVMFHWTSQSMPERGPLKSYNDAVNDFDVSLFVNMVKKTGAGYVIFTTNHAEPYFPAPLKEWEKVYPGHTTQRDLVKEIADALEKQNIRLLLYMATHIYARYDSVNDKEFNRLNHTLVSEVGERYKEKVAGYWFDGWYQSYEKHPDFDFERFYKICKTGNPDRLVCFNTWLYPIGTLWQDYWPGEVYTISSPATHQFIENGPGRGLQAHSLIVMETEDWLHTKKDTKIPAPHLKAEELVKFIAESKGKGPVTINIQIHQDGRISDEALAVMENISKELIGGVD